MKLLEKVAIIDLVHFYELYIRQGIVEEIKKKAKILYDGAPSSTLVNDSISSLFGSLFPIAYPGVTIKISSPTKEEAKCVVVEMINYFFLFLL